MLSACRHREELGQAPQIDHGHHQGEGLAYPVNPAQLGLVHAAMLLGISKHCLQQFANGQADAVSGMPCRARIDRAAPVRGVLRHVRGYVEFPAALDEQDCRRFCVSEPYFSKGGKLWQSRRNWLTSC